MKIIIDKTSSMQESTIKFSQDTMNMLYDRFGMFIHFGVYSKYAGMYKGKKQSFGSAEWIMRFEEIPLAEYQKTAYEFVPDLGWAEELAKEAKKVGVKYAVLTTKHHDGFCLFESNYSVYNSYHFNGRDLVKEYVDAMRKEGIKPGFYYSHTLDWAERDGAGQVNLAFCGREAKNDNYWDYPDREQKDFSRYFYGKCMPQVKELLENYGDVYLLWFDFAHDITIEQSRELYELVKEKQPQCLVNSRIAHGYGDYNSLGDNTIPTVSIGVPNECLITLNHNWGYCSHDNDWKTPEEIIGMLARCTSGQSTLLMNVGPMASGKLPEETSKILSVVGKWTEKNLEAIRGVKDTPFKCGFDWGSVSRSLDGKILYLYLTDNLVKEIHLSGINGKINKVSELCGEEQDYLYMDGKLSIYVNVKGKIVPVIKVEFDDAPVFSDVNIQHGDTLALKPIYGEKFRIEDDVCRNVELVFEHNIYDPKWGLRGLSLERNDSVMAWATDDEYLQWCAEFVDCGKYKIQLTTAELGGNSYPIVEINGKEYGKEISIDNADSKFRLSRTGDDNIRYNFILGEAVIEKGKTDVILKRKENGHNIAVSEIKFIREK